MIRKKPACRHDHKNAIQIGNIDFVCPLCRNLIDPGEWFLMNSFTFVDEVIEKGKQPGSIAGHARKQIESKIGRKAITKARFQKLRLKELE
ncbi:hypothetical protein HY477_00125 [Candidatus Uhrbacteria bacterium]|nr:hypothetical protein [Candidatus Uhrbacteria bacterium]